MILHNVTYEAWTGLVAEVQSLREALKQERLVRMEYRRLLDCYEAALHACVVVEPEKPKDTTTYIDLTHRENYR